MDLRRALKDEKVPAKTVLLGREFQWSMTREKKENFEEFKRTGSLQSMKGWPRNDRSQVNVMTIIHDSN